MDQLWWELNNRECGEGLTDVKSDGGDIVVTRSIGG